MTTGYWFLGTPYTHYPTGLASAYVAACRQTGLLLKAGVQVFSPIVHCHAVADILGMNKTDLAIWLPACAGLRAAAGGLIVCRLASWERSTGLAAEREEFERAGKPVVDMMPDILPALPALC